MRGPSASARRLSLSVAACQCARRDCTVSYYNCMEATTLVTFHFRRCVCVAPRPRGVHHECVRLDSRLARPDAAYRGLRAGGGAPRCAGALTACARTAIDILSAVRFPSVRRCFGFAHFADRSASTKSPCEVCRRSHRRLWRTHMRTGYSQPFCQFSLTWKLHTSGEARSKLCRGVEREKISWKICDWALALASRSENIIAACAAA